MAALQHNMDTLLQSDEFRDKLKRIPPHLKAVFIKAVEDLYDRESEKMLHLIWESRREMRETYITMEGEQNDLRCQSRMLEERRKEADRDYLHGRKSRNGRTTSRMSTTSDITSARGSRGDAANYNRPNYDAHASDVRDLKLPEIPGARASSAGQTHRSAPTPVFVKSIEELRDELFKHLSNAETKVESERERQKELLEWLKAEKRNKQQTKVEKANELLEEVNHMEQIKAKDKERQEQRLKERLEEKKKLKEGRESTMPPVETIALETIVQIEPEPNGAEAIDDETSKEKKDKRKKKKHRHKEDEENEIGEEGRKEKREKKKKHKRKDDEKEASLEFENEESKEKRKEKKKNRHRQEDENGVVTEDGVDGETEKKEKKKKHRHRRESNTEGLQNGHEETAEDIERRERKKEKKRNKKEKKRAEEEEAEDEV